MKRKELWHVIDADLETLFSVWNQTGPCFVEASNETITFNMSEGGVESVSKLTLSEFTEEETMMSVTDLVH